MMGVDVIDKRGSMAKQFGELIKLIVDMLTTIEFCSENIENFLCNF